MRQKRQKDNRSLRIYRRKTVALLFFALLVFISLLELIPVERNFSEKENRSLQTRPRLTLQSVASGTYMEQYEAFRSDQFLGRNLWGSLKTRMDLLTGKRESNGVYKGKDQYLLEKIARADQKKIEEDLGAMEEFKVRYEKSPMYFALVPNAANILEDKLPRFAVTEDQREIFGSISRKLWEGITWVDLSKPLGSHSTEEIYYRTDSH